MPAVGAGGGTGRCARRGSRDPLACQRVVPDTSATAKGLTGFFSVRKIRRGALSVGGPAPVSLVGGRAVTRDPFGRKGLLWRRLDGRRVRCSRNAAPAARRFGGRYAYKFGGVAPGR